MLGGPIHEIRSILQNSAKRSFTKKTHHLVGPEKKDFWISPSGDVDNRTFDARRSTRDEEIHDGLLCLVTAVVQEKVAHVDILFEALAVIRIDSGKDRSLRPTFRDILVLCPVIKASISLHKLTQVLRCCQGVILVKQGPDIRVVIPNLIRHTSIRTGVELTPFRANG